MRAASPGARIAPTTEGDNVSLRLPSAVVLIAAMAVPAAAQPALDRVLGNSPSGQPFTVGGQWQQLVGSLARATGVAMGVETAGLSLVRPVGTKLTGLTLRGALDTLARETGYEWREMDGVILLRPRRAWMVLPHPLEIEVEQVRFEEAIAQQALAVACAALGASESGQMPERRRFSFIFPGGRLIDYLNAVVREHGALAWSFARTPQNGPAFPFTVGFSSGSSGIGCGVPGVPPPSPIDVEGILARKAVPVAPTENVLDRAVGLGVHDQPLRLYSIHESGLRDLATAARVPMGLQKAEGRPPIFREGFVATGAPLRMVLDALVVIDPRYEWRLLDGVVVVRPREAWDDLADPLAVRADAVRLLDEPIGKLAASIERVLGGQRSSQDFPDSRLVWLDLPPGTAFDLLCALARAHGDLVWVFEEQDAEDKKVTGLVHRLWWLAGGGGKGIPVR
jgi:hypothetical protein